MATPKPVCAALKKDLTTDSAKLPRSFKNAGGGTPQRIRSSLPWSNFFPSSSILNIVFSQFADTRSLP
jgi:hypothetical protein